MAKRIVNHDRATPIYVKPDVTTTIVNTSASAVVFNEDPNELNATPVGTQPLGTPIAAGATLQIAVSGAGRTFARTIATAPVQIDVS